MKPQEKKQVAETLTEKSQWIKVGWLPFKMRPLTLAQIYDMGVFASQIETQGLEKKDKVQVLAELINHHEAAKLMIEVFVVCLFRTRKYRWLFKRYIGKRLTVIKFQELIQFIATSINANFFLTSIIFLRQTATITEPSQMTARGQSWEES